MADGTEQVTLDREGVSRAFSDRAGFEAALDTLVDTNRFTIAVVFPLIGAVTLLASAQGLLPSLLSFNPALVLFGVFVMRLPLVSGLLPLVDRRGAVALSLLFAYTYAIEFLGATRGIPYGEFSYNISLGPMLAGTIPVALPLFFVPLVVNSYLLCLLLLRGRAASPLVRLPVVAATVVAVDLVLDPAAVALGFWEFAEGGFYGVPAMNYAGWVLSAVVATVLIDAAFDREQLRERVEVCPYMLDDMVSFVLLWGAVNAFYQAWVPVAIAAGFGVALLATDRFDFDVAPL
ncbi:bisanhydrobacterioruberin hydratase [Halovenus salina]|uniref:bisanhydrobacterioruberin hydratase n=1 Tax=Halovenus salina TaxID=1510225 RepID=UPI002260E596|nr:bisanhydrobacterioruberin hydratase [Halovenus salina]